MEAKSYQKLIVWQKSMDLAVLMYDKTRTFPKEELFGLTSQMRRASSSIPANIAEGYMREGKKEYAHYLGYSRGSCAELETYLLLAQRLKYVNEPDYLALIQLETEVSKMLYVLQSKIKLSRS